MIRSEEKTVIVGTAGKVGVGGYSGLSDFDGAESRQRPVDEEDLDGDVGLDVGLGEKRDVPR